MFLSQRIFVSYIKQLCLLSIGKFENFLIFAFLLFTFASSTFFDRILELLTYFPLNQFETTVNLNFRTTD